MDDLDLAQLVEKAKKTQSEEVISQSGFEIVAQNWLKYYKTMQSQENASIRKKNKKNEKENERREKMNVKIVNKRKKKQRMLKITQEFSNETYAEKFVKTFFEGYEKRSSSKKTRNSKTKPDELIDELIKVDIKDNLKGKIITEENITKLLDVIREAHRYSMNVENIIGSILEEYLHEKLLQFGWAICWGECLPGVDICNKDGILLQIKNKDNTENSSSSKIRERFRRKIYGKKIDKWKRLIADSGNNCWDELNETHLHLDNSNKLSEEDFTTFAKDMVQKRGSTNRIFAEKISDLLELQL